MGEGWRFSKEFSHAFKCWLKMQLNNLSTKGCSSKNLHLISSVKLWSTFKLVASQKNYESALLPGSQGPFGGLWGTSKGANYFWKHCFVLVLEIIYLYLKKYEIISMSRIITQQVFLTRLWLEGPSVWNCLSWNIFFYNRYANNNIDLKCLGITDLSTSKVLRAKQQYHTFWVRGYVVTGLVC